MEKGLSPKARELLEKIRAAGEKGITSPEIRKMGDLGHAPLDDLTDKGLIEEGWRGNVRVWRIRER